jgi:chaperonin cofactor prefoldin
LITLTCPNCGGTLESAGQDTYVCKYCGSVHRLRDHPDWLKDLQENLDQLKTELTSLQSSSRIAASAQALPGLLIGLDQLSQALQARARAIFISLLVFGLGYFLNRWLVFGPASSLFNFLPFFIMLLGGLALIYLAIRTLLLLRQRRQLNQQIEHCREAIRKLGE